MTVLNLKRLSSVSSNSSSSASTTHSSLSVIDTPTDKIFVSNSYALRGWYWRWIMLFFACVIMFSFTCINTSLNTHTKELRSYMNLTNTEVQTFSVSFGFVLAIPLSIFGALIIDRIGLTKSIIAWTVALVIGWFILCTGIQHKELIVMNVARMIAGGSTSAIRLSFNLFCVIWFPARKFIALSMGIIRCSYNIATIFAPWLILSLFTTKLKWSVQDVFWRLIGFAFLSFFSAICIAIISFYVKQTQRTVNCNKNTPQQNIDEAIIPPQTTSCANNDGGAGEVSETATTVESGGSNTHVTAARKRGAKLPQISIATIVKLLKNPLFVLLIFVGFCYDASATCFAGVIKELLGQQFDRNNDQISFDMGIAKYCGLLAPLFGYVIDTIKYREFFMLSAGIFICLGHGTLYFVPFDKDVSRIFGLLCLSLGQVLYNNSFWPAVASIVGNKKDSTIAYGILGAITGLGPLIIPLIIGKFADSSNNIIVAELILSIVVIIGIMSNIPVILINCRSIKVKDTDYINRQIESKENDVGKNTKKEHKEYLNKHVQLHIVPQNMCQNDSNVQTV